MMTSCQLTSVPLGAFRNQVGLGILDLSGNRLKFLPDGLLDNSKFLIYAVLRDNLIQSVSEVLLKNNPLIEFVDLATNKLIALPEKVFHNNPKLSILTLISNRLTYLPPGIFKKNPLLSSIFLNYNQLKSIPDGLWDNNKRLDYLILHSNMLSVLPDRVLHNMTMLRMLMLQQNNLTSSTLSRTFFMNLPSLYSLFASYNNIEHIQDYSFSKCPSLNYIVMNNNQIRYITNGTFYGAFQLKSLFLIANPIEYIEDGAFSSNNIMETLYILQTNIKTVNVKWYNPLFVYKARTVVQVYATTNSETSPITVPPTVAFGYQSSGFHCTNYFEIDISICSPCLTGSYVSYTNNSYTCKDCPAGGFYQDTMAVYVKLSVFGNGCKLCDNGTFVRTAPGRSKGDCRPCPEGTNSRVFASFRACRCQDGFYRLDRFDKCYPCPNSGVWCFNESMTLKAGYYWQWISKAEKDYYINFTSNLQIFDDTYDRDLVHFNGSFPKHYQCPRSESCLGGLDAECAEGYTGPLCAVCDKRHYQLVANCFKCPSIPWLIFQICGIFFLVLTIIFVVVKGEKRKAGDKRSLTDIVLARLKIIVSFYQISSGTLDAFSYVQWPSALTKMSEYAKFVQLNILQIAPLHCFNSRLKMDAYADLVITCSMTAGVILTALAYYHMKRVYLSKRAGKSPLQSELDATKEACYRNVFLFIFVTYPQTCSKIFQMLPASCHRICQDSSQQQCTSYLKADYSITCFTHKYNQYVILAYVAMIYPFAVPLLTALVLWKYHYKRTLVKGKDGERNEIARSMVREEPSASVVTASNSGKEHNAIKTRSDHIEIIPEEQKRTASVKHSVPAEETPNPQQMQLKNHLQKCKGNGHKNIRPENKSKTSKVPTFSLTKTVRAVKATKVLSKTKDQTEDDGDTSSESSDVSTVPIVAGMSFIFENYADNCWFWEIIEMTRKMLLTSTLALISAEGRNSLGIASILSGCYAILHAHFMPIPDKFEHALQLTSLLVTFSNTCIGMMLKIDQSALLDADARIMDSLIITALLVTANVMVTALVVIKYTIAIGQSIYYLIKNPRCSLECCLSIMLTIDEVQGEARSMDDNSAWKMNTQLSQGNDFEVPGVQDVAGDFGLTGVEMGDEDEDENEDEDVKQNKHPEEEKDQSFDEDVQP